MKKIIALTLTGIILLGITIVGVSSCNRQIIDLTYSYNYAYIQLQNGEVIEGHVSSWRDYEDGDQLQIVIDGKTYLVHASNCTLMYDPTK